MTDESNNASHNSEVAVRLYKNHLDAQPGRKKYEEAIFSGSHALQVNVLLAAIGGQKSQLGIQADERRDLLILQLLKINHEFAPIHLVGILRRGAREDWRIVKQILRAAERFGESADLTEELRSALRSFAAAFSKQRNTYESRTPKQIEHVRERVSALLAEEVEETIELGSSEPWAQKLTDDLEQFSTSDRAAILSLIAHASSASAGKPSAKWLKEAGKRLGQLDATFCASALTVWFEHFDRAAERMVDYRSEWAIADVNADVLKGLIWTTSLIKDDGLVRALGRVGISGQRKIPGMGPRASRVTNAAIWALGQIDSPIAISQLAILKSRIKNKSVQKQLDKAMAEVAARLGVSPELVEELAVPTFGLTEVGKRVEQFGEYTAELVVTGTNATQLRWRKPDGSPQKSVPKTVRDEYADALKELKSAAKDIQKLVPVQRDRIDSLFLRRHVWSFSDWSERYLDHPLVGTVARRLIWEFGSEDKWVAAIWQGDSLVSVKGEDVLLDPEATSVRLWHPIEQSVEAVCTWREFLVDREVTQPFKQAHREVYLLTDAERNTQVYSNRYAAHILKQHQFNALCGARRWKNSLRLMVDACYPPAMRYLPEWNLRAEFWVEGIGDNYGVATNDTGTYWYLATDQVRFYPIDADENQAYAGGGGYAEATIRDSSEPIPVPISDVPPMVFSEIMRDVDLFVGVASVGNDPNWNDGGPEGLHRDYWYDYSFGDLSATATTRKQILERLVPRLKIGKKCTFDEKFLVVEGSKRTYKIHLGSGNIIMKPNDQYLCIVPKAASLNAASNKVFLPFEGDRTMSIILSKAFLLADDAKITDPTILSQIG